MIKNKMSLKGYSKNIFESEILYEISFLKK